ncbi:MAG: hypothetical protein JJT88_13615 [Gammaproteobacteria bacterium]|nr:hypothetical protein [Gammaproteobacteria bacterium]
MRFLLAAVSALVVMGLTIGGFLFLLDRYERHHREAVLAEVTIDAAGQIRIDGQSIGFEQLRSVWRDRAFRLQHCGRWRLEVHPDAPAGLGHAVAAVIECR